MTTQASTKYLVSAIVSTYNSERFIRGCLEDLEAQTIAERVEIIVIDAGSQQNERAVVEEFQRVYDNIRYVRLEQRETIYAAWNRGAQIATGSYLTSANTDDRHRADAFERLVQAIERDPGCAAVYADCAVTTTENQTFDAADVISYFNWPDADPRTLFLSCYLGPQPLWRRSVHERHGWFDSAMRAAGDYEFWLRLAVKGERFVHLPEVLGLYLTSPASLEHSDPSGCEEESERARVRYWPAAWGTRPKPGRGYRVPYVGKRPLVTVVVPTRNRENLLGDALKSLIGQDYDRWQAIVVNDGGRAVDELVRTLDNTGRIQCLNHFASFGPAAARNTALRVARGTIICYLDDDDLYRPNHLSTVVGAMQETLAQFVYTDSELVTEMLDDGVRRVRERRQRKGNNRDFSKQALHVRNYIPINTWGHHRDCLVKTGLFNETFRSHEDWEFLIRMARSCEFRHVPVVTVEVRVRAGAVDSVTTQHAHKLDVFRRIYDRFSEFSRDPVVRRERRKCLGALAALERASRQSSVRRRALLWSLMAVGGFLPVQRKLREYFGWHTSHESPERH